MQEATEPSHTICSLPTLTLASAHACRSLTIPPGPPPPPEAQAIWVKERRRASQACQAQHLHGPSKFWVRGGGQWLPETFLVKEGVKRTLITAGIFILGGGIRGTVKFATLILTKLSCTSFEEVSGSAGEAQ